MFSVNFVLHIEGSSSGGDYNGNVLLATLHRLHFGASGSKLQNQSRLDLGCTVTASIFHVKKTIIECVLKITYLILTVEVT